MGDKFRLFLTNPMNVWFPFVVSMSAVLIYGSYLFFTTQYLIINDFFGHVWMALEDMENGIGSSTNVVVPAGYPIILNFLHLLGLDYMSAGRFLTLLSFALVLFFVWISSSRAAETYWAGIFACLITATSYKFLLAAATPLPDMAALAMVIPLIMVSFDQDRSQRSLFLASMFGGLSCNLRYSFLQSIVPLAIIFLLFVNPAPWRERWRNAQICIVGLIVGLIPEIIFALKAGHIPFQNASKYYLTLITGETNFLMNATQFRQMPSTVAYVFKNKHVILPIWFQGYISTVMIYILTPAISWGILEVIGRVSKQQFFNYILRRRLAALLVLNLLLLIPISLRQPLPYYFSVIPASISFIIIAILLGRLINNKKEILALVFVILIIMSLLQLNKAMSRLHDEKSYLSFNYAVARTLYDYGIRDSAEVINLLDNPFILYWPYGNKSPLPYYILKEPGWYSLTNTFSEKRPFIYNITPKVLEQFKAVLTRSVPETIQAEYLSDFQMVRKIGYVEIYIVNRRNR